MKERLAAQKAKKAKKDARKGVAKVEGGVEKPERKKKWIAAEHVPAGATKEVWASMFVGNKEEKDSFTTRGVIGRSL